MLLLSQINEHRIRTHWQWGVRTCHVCVRVIHIGRRESALKKVFTKSKRFIWTKLCVRPGTSLCRADKIHFSVMSADGRWPQLKVNVCGGMCGAMCQGRPRTHFHLNLLLCSCYKHCGITFTYDHFQQFHLQTRIVSQILTFSLSSQTESRYQFF